MLSKLTIANFLLIDNLQLEFHHGLTVLTGETGSGKSIMVDALLFIFASTTKDGKIVNVSSKAQLKEFLLYNKDIVLEAEFRLNSHTNTLITDWIQQYGFNDTNNPDLLVCKRVVNAHNLQSRFFINGFIATNKHARELSEILLAVHGQFSSMTLLKPDTQRSLVDSYAKANHLVAQLRSLCKQTNSLQETLHHLIGKQQLQEQQEQELVLDIKELESLNLQEEQWQSLENRHKELTNANNILAELDFAHNSLTGGHNDESFNHQGVIRDIAKLNNRLISLSKLSERVTPITELLEDVIIKLTEADGQMSTLANNIEQDPTALATIEAKMAAIFAVSRKHNVPPQELSNLLITKRAALANLIDECLIEDTKKELNSCQEQYHQLALLTSTKRTAAVNEITNRMNRLLAKLGLNGTFSITNSIHTVITSYGYDNMEFQVSFNPGMPLKPLAKSASGGELSRVSLALYLLLSAHTAKELIIFDEIDVGIGGKIASAIGKMLRQLAHHKQVICITHQPQTASYGNNHFIVRKNTNASIVNSNTSTVNKVIVAHATDQERVMEIARMLSSNEISALAIEHAKEMLTTATCNNDIDY